MIQGFGFKPKLSCEAAVEALIDGSLRQEHRRRSAFLDFLTELANAAEEAAAWRRCQRLSEPLEHG
jgi:hypothetical protein